MASVRLMHVALVLLLCCTVGLDAGCSYSKIIKEITEYGTILRYCDWHGLHMLPGSILYDKERCNKVVCRLRGLKSCGIGIEAGTQLGPPGCRAVPDGCHVRFVEAANPSKTCVLE